MEISLAHRKLISFLLIKILFVCLNGPRVAATNKIGTERELVFQTHVKFVFQLVSNNLINDRGSWLMQVWWAVIGCSVNNLVSLFSVKPCHVDKLLSRAFKSIAAGASINLNARALSIASDSIAVDFFSSLYVWCQQQLLSCLWLEDISMNDQKRQLKLDLCKQKETRPCRRENKFLSSIKAENRYCTNLDYKKFSETKKLTANWKHWKLSRWKDDDELKQSAN